MYCDFASLASSLRTPVGNREFWLKYSVCQSGGGYVCKDDDAGSVWDSSLISLSSSLRFGFVFLAMADL
jgi:hypothetical protein